jgi:hypothetical protein
MDILSADDLLNRARYNWGIVDEQQFPVICDLIESNTATMRRIHDIIYLTRNDVEIPTWFREETNGLSPLQLLGMGKVGMAKVEASLIAEFRRAASPAIFPSAGPERDSGREIRVLSRLLHERIFPPQPEGDARPCYAEVETWGVHDPLLDRRIAQPSGKIVDAISALAQRYGDFTESTVVAFHNLLDVAVTDPNRETRLGVVRAAAAIVGQAHTADLLATVQDDVDLEVRETALVGLVRLAHDPQMHARIALFARDADRKLRTIAFKALVGQKLDPAMRGAMVHLVFDAAPDLKTQARWFYDEEELAAAVAELCAAAAAGEPMYWSDLRAVATEPGIDPARRAEVFCRRFAALCNKPKGEDAAVDTLRALGLWRDPIPAAVQEGARAVARRWGAAAEKMFSDVKKQSARHGEPRFIEVG